MLSFQSTGLSIDKNKTHLKKLKTFKNLSCIIRRVHLDLLTIDINFGFLLDGRILIKVEAMPKNILA
jgi:hypothetical protein